MTSEILIFHSEAEWLAWKGGASPPRLGASSVAATIGLPVFGDDAASVIGRHAGTVPPIVSTVPMRLGLYLEQFVVGLYRERTGRKVEWCGPDKRIWLHPCGLLYATLDSVVTYEDGTTGPLQVKTHSILWKSGFTKGKDGGLAGRELLEVQVQTERVCYDSQRASWVVLWMGCSKETELLSYADVDNVGNWGEKLPAIAEEYSRNVLSAIAARDACAPATGGAA